MTVSVKATFVRVGRESRKLGKAFVVENKELQMLHQEELP